MLYLLDTDICVYIQNERPPRVQERLARESLSSVGLSSIVIFELTHGILKSAQPERNFAVLERLTNQTTVFDFDVKAARAAARVRRQLEAGGQPIGAYDTLIAGHALALSATLVTNNLREFSRIANLRVENWTL